MLLPDSFDADEHRVMWGPVFAFGHAIPRCPAPLPGIVDGRARCCGGLTMSATYRVGLPEYQTAAGCPRRRTPVSVPCCPPPEGGRRGEQEASMGRTRLAMYVAMLVAGSVLTVASP